MPTLREVGYFWYYPRNSLYAYFQDELKELIRKEHEKIDKINAEQTDKKEAKKDDSVKK